MGLGHATNCRRYNSKHLFSAMNDMDWRTGWMNRWCVGWANEINMSHVSSINNTLISRTQFKIQDKFDLVVYFRWIFCTVFYNMYILSTLNTHMCLMQGHINNGIVNYYAKPWSLRCHILLAMLISSTLCIFWYTSIYGEPILARIQNLSSVLKPTY